MLEEPWLGTQDEQAGGWPGKNLPLQSSTARPSSEQLQLQAMPGMKISLCSKQIPSFHSQQHLAGSSRRGANVVTDLWVTNMVWQSWV